MLLDTIALLLRFFGIRVNNAVLLIFLRNYEWDLVMHRIKKEQFKYLVNRI